MMTLEGIIILMDVIFAILVPLIACYCIKNQVVTILQCVMVIIGRELKLELLSAYQKSVYAKHSYTIMWNTKLLYDICVSLCEF